MGPIPIRQYTSQGHYVGKITDYDLVAVPSRQMISDDSLAV